VAISAGSYLLNFLGLLFSAPGRYDPLSFFAVNTTYGTPDDLKALVNEAHKRNMIVIFDFIANHMSSRNILQWWDGTNLYFYDGMWEQC
jgi:1,4-alpha-glucan branching enzyme